MQYADWFCDNILMKCQAYFFYSDTPNLEWITVDREKKNFNLLIWSEKSKRASSLCKWTECLYVLTFIFSASGIQMSSWGPISNVLFCSNGHTRQHGNGTHLNTGSTPSAEAEKLTEMYHPHWHYTFPTTSRIFWTPRYAYEQSSLQRSSRRL